MRFSFHKMTMNLRITRCIIPVFCLAMNMLNIYLLCEEYLTYKVTSQADISIPEVIEMPSFVICVDIPANIKWKQMTQNQSSWLLVDSKIANHSSVIIDRMFHLFNVSDIIQKTKEFHEIVHHSVINSLFIPNKSEESYVSHHTKDQNYPFEVKKTFIWNERKCFSLRLKDHLNKVISYEELESIDVQNSLVMFQFYPHTEAISFYVIKSGNVITSHDSLIVLHPGQHLHVRYTSYTSMLLSYPYETNCREYRQFGFDSRAHCKQKCIKHLAIKTFGVIPSNVNAYAHDSLPIRGRFDVFANHSLEKSIITQCANLCHHKDCYSVKYILSESRDRYHNMMHDNRSSVDVGVSGNPVSKTKAQPAVSLIAFLGKVFSTFVFWLGLSVIPFFLCSKI